MNLHHYHKILPRTENRDGSWDVLALAQSYSWPSKLAGGGVIGIVELGGGWLPTDVQKFCALNGVASPSVTDVSVDGTTNTPGQSDADGEVALDIEVAAASYFAATGKPATIRMYWSQDIAAAVRKAATECDVISISWGSDEAQWGRADVFDMEAAAFAATKMGCIVLAASGDNDSSDGGPTPANVDCPASCIHVIGCGGTKKTLNSETVWNDRPGAADGDGTGGGFSTVFPPQSWQAGAPVGPGRMVPDIAANADPSTGYNIVLNGEIEIVGGTSAVAPLMAGLFASFGKKLGMIGPKIWLNHLDWTDITVGDNGKYRARQGPDACTGLGSPIGSRLATLFSAHPVPLPHPIPKPGV